MRIILGMMGFFISVVATFVLVVIRVKENLIKNDRQKKEEIKNVIHRYDLMQRDCMIVILISGTVFLIMLLFLS